MRALDQLLAAISEVPHFGPLVVGTFVAIIAEIVLAVIATRRLDRQDRWTNAVTADGEPPSARPPSPALPSRLAEIIALLIPLAIVGLFVAVVQESRHEIAMGVRMTGPNVDHNERTALISRGISHELNGLAFAANAIALVAAVASVTLGLSVSARLRARGLARAATELGLRPDHAVAWVRFPGLSPINAVLTPLAFVILGAGPLWFAFVRSVPPLIHAWATVPSVPAENKVASLDSALRRMEETLSSGIGLATIGAVVTSVLAIVLAWIGSPMRARKRLLGLTADAEPRGLGRAVAAFVAAVLVAAVAIFLAAPMLNENALPWPPPEGGERLLARVDTPDLEGPDPIERAPVIALVPAGLFLDGMQTDLPRMVESLSTLRDNYHLLQPGRPFNGQFVLLADRDTPGSQMIHLLAGLGEIEYGHPRFVFLRPQVTDRPLFGRLQRNRLRAALCTTASTSEPAGDDAEAVEVTAEPTYAALAEQVVAIRRRGHEAVLRLPHKALTSTVTPVRRRKR